MDVANVMGARPDGWWRDRAGAALRLGREVAALARRSSVPATAWVLVLEGRAREAAPLLAEELRAEELRAEELRAEEAAGAPVRVVSAPGSGDDAIVQVVVQAIARDESCLVVTADRELRQRCEELSASVVGPGWLLGRL